MDHKLPADLHRGSIDPVLHPSDSSTSESDEDEPCNFKIIDFGHACSQT